MSDRKNNSLSPEDLTSVAHRLNGGIEGHWPSAAGRSVVCSCGWHSLPVDDYGNYTAAHAKRDFDTHVDTVRPAGPVNVGPDFEEKRKAFALTNEQMQEMGDSVFQCVKCRKEYFGGECRVNVLGAREGELVSLERSWTLECPDKACRGAVVRVRAASGAGKGRKFFGRLLGRVQ